MNKHPKKLTLRKETMLQLGGGDLGQVAGGVKEAVISVSCPSTRPPSDLCSVFC